MKHGQRNEPWEGSSQGALRASKICSQTSPFRTRLGTEQSKVQPGLKCMSRNCKTISFTLIISCLKENIFCQIFEGVPTSVTH